MHAGGPGLKKKETFQLSSVPRWADLYPEVSLLSEENNVLNLHAPHVFLFTREML